ncbi:hypothetical protein [Fodinicola feengrottensis]|uniref:hypothetical protein n=1 Tax=Fodinicola feengrottensis TaxID=435914 RepID=UPI0013D4E563|nr:hypothetical protein [Fodinicola feengrottensis]
MQRLRPVVLGIADQLIDRFEGGRSDVVADYAAVLPFHVVAGLLGVPEDDWPRLVDWSIPMRNVGVLTTEQTWRLASERSPTSPATWASWSSGAGPSRPTTC